MVALNYVPSNNEVKKYLQIWDMLDEYVAHEIALTLIFNNYPENVDTTCVLLKCSVLNSFYSAGVRNVDLLKVADVIVDCDIDKDLHDGNWKVVGRILESFNKAGLRNYYSFVSKYCNWHNPERFPIYDSYVDDVVWYLKQNNCINSFKHRNELNDYKTFGNALFEIYQKFSLTSVEIPDKNLISINYKLLDKYLWLLGKHYFALSSHSVNDILKAEKLVSKNLHVASFESYIITRSINGIIKVCNDGVIVTNTKKALRQISHEIGFCFNPDWNTRQFGKKIIEYINLNKSSL